MLPAAALIASLALAESEPMTPSLSADLDGDGTVETVTAKPGRGVVRLDSRSGAKKKASATAPAPPADVVRVSLTAALLGSPGSILEVDASTDTSECVSMWRYRDAALTRIPLRDASGRELPDCEPAGIWTRRWERDDANAPSVFVRERAESVERGRLLRRQVFVFAGFSLDLNAGRSSAAIEGIPIPRWYPARFYTVAGLDLLYRRFDLPKFRVTPTLRIVTDRERGVFALRFRTPTGEIVAPVEAFSTVPADASASILARAGEKTVRARVRLGGDGNVPVEVRIDGLDPELDVIYAPAGTWRGDVRHVFLSAADEIAAQYLTGSWSAPGGRTVPIEIEGSPPYGVRFDGASYRMEMDASPVAADFALRPVAESAGGRPWGVRLRGPNAIERIPLVCAVAAEGGAGECRPDGPPETLRRLGARVNVN